ncbi:MAG: class I SAM-dependent methyltransferase, partial [Geminicoccaceae bacterium]
MLASEIRARGPLSLARYMELALGHPAYGYYRRREPLGASGDFITAPEISQAFGEILALWLAQAWSDLGRPAPVRLVELGPGRGTLMADMLRAASRVAGFRQSLDVRLVETSERLRVAQRARLAGHEVRWHAAFEEVPQGPLLLIANEIFDALPVRQLVRAAHGWVERRVGLDDKGALGFVEDRELAPPAALADIPGHEAAPPGTVAEVSPARTALARAIGARIAR